MRIINYAGSKPSTPACSVPVAPVYLAPVTVDIPADMADPTIPTEIHAVAEGGIAPHGGQITVGSGCSAVKLEIDFITGGNCDPCDDPDELTVETQERIIDANSVGYSIDQRYRWSAIRALAVDAAGVETAVTSPIPVTVEAEWAKECPSCPDTIVPAV